jgi:putative peptidoglycan lipid II flippase
MACSTPIFSLIFMGGAFDYAKAVSSSQALMYYSLGLAFVAMTRVLVPAFYALKDTKTPVITALIAFVLNLCFSLALMGPLKHGGLALASSLSAFGNMLLLLWFLRRKLGAFGGAEILTTGLKSLAGSIPMGIAVWYACTLIDWSQTGHKTVKASLLGVTILAGSAIYLAMVRLLKTAEAMEVISMIKKKLGRQ